MKKKKKKKKAFKPIFFGCLLIYIAFTCQSISFLFGNQGEFALETVTVQHNTHHVCFFGMTMP